MQVGGSGAVVVAGNRLVRFRGDTMVYDADGNLLKRSALVPGGRTDSLVWNALGQLVSVVRNGVTIATFGYDGLGRRVRKTAGGVTSAYLHDGDHLLLELDGTGTRVAEYTYGPGVDHPVSVRRWSGGTAQTYYYASEEPGSIVGLIDVAGNLAARYGYAPFGTLIDSVGTVPNTLRFAAREFDGETGLYYNRARYYDPVLGRFISEDPIGLAGGVNLYAYVENDPINNTDPSGLDCITFLEVTATVCSFGQCESTAYYKTVCMGGGGGRGPGSGAGGDLPSGGGGGGGGGGTAGPGKSVARAVEKFKAKACSILQNWPIPGGGYRGVGATYAIGPYGLTGGMGVYSDNGGPGGYFRVGWAGGLQGSAGRETGVVLGGLSGVSVEAEAVLEGRTFGGAVSIPPSGLGVSRVSNGNAAGELPVMGHIGVTYTATKSLASLCQ